MGIGWLLSPPPNRHRAQTQHDGACLFLPIIIIIIFIAAVVFVTVHILLFSHASARSVSNNSLPSPTMALETPSLDRALSQDGRSAQLFLPGFRPALSRSGFAGFVKMAATATEATAAV